MAQCLLAKTSRSLAQGPGKYQSCTASASPCSTTRCSLPGPIARHPAAAAAAAATGVRVRSALTCRQQVSGLWLAAQCAPLLLPSQRSAPPSRLSHRRVRCQPPRAQEEVAADSRKAVGERVAGQLKGASVFLVGMMGSGKSTIGRIVAQSLSYVFFDSDDIVEQAAGRTVSEIFAEDGEEVFREAEAEVLKQLSAVTRAVISTGGGAVLRTENWGSLNHGIVVWLDVPVHVLASRLIQSELGTRPLLQPSRQAVEGSPGEVEDKYLETCTRLGNLLKQRRDFYANADATVHAAALGIPEEDVTPELLAEQVLLEIEKCIQQSRHQAKAQR